MYKSLLDVERVDELVFKNVRHRENFKSTLFGGQVLAQALMAATKTVEERRPHSLHAYFLRAGNSESPIFYHVDKIRDGASIASRRVVAKQNNKAIFHLSASFHKQEDGYEHNARFPEDTPLPEQLKGFLEAPKHAPEHGNVENEASPFHIIPITQDIFTSRETHSPDAKFWVRTVADMPDTPAFHAVTLAFASDLGLLATTLLPHPSSLFSEDIFAASIDHAMWIHANAFDTTQWMLFSIQSPWAGNARGFAQGTIHDRNGKLIASLAQEGLIRPL